MMCKKVARSPDRSQQKQKHHRHLAVFLVVTEFAIYTAITAEWTVDTDGVLTVKLWGYALGRT